MVDTLARRHPDWVYGTCEVCGGDAVIDLGLGSVHPMCADLPEVEVDWDAVE